MYKISKLFFLLVVLSVLFVPAVGTAMECGSGMVPITCPGHGTTCAVSPAICCGASVCGAGMGCLSCPKTGPVCVVNPAVCCGGNPCGGGMQCRTTSLGPECFVPVPGVVPGVAPGGPGVTGGGGPGGAGGGAPRTMNGAWKLVCKGEFGIFDSSEPVTIIVEGDFDFKIDNKGNLSGSNRMTSMEWKSASHNKKDKADKKFVVTGAVNGDQLKATTNIGFSASYVGRVKLHTGLNTYIGQGSIHSMEDTSCTGQWKTR